MTTQIVSTVHNYIARFIALKGHSPTPEHLSRHFGEPVRKMRAALASYAEARRA